MRKPTIVILAVIAVLGLTGCTGASGPQLAVMDGGSEAELPEWLENDDTLAVINLTKVGEVDDLIVFASHNDADEWCVIATLAPTDEFAAWVASSSCTSPALFDEQGITVGLGNQHRAAGVQLIPDNYTGTIEADWVRVNDNLLVRE
jgi:hypothetical protein